MMSLQLPAYFILAMQAGACFGVGMLIGAFHFLTLRWSVSRLAAGQAGLLPIATQVARSMLLIGVLAVLAGRFGASLLLCATAGIIVARTGAIRLELAS